MTDPAEWSSEDLERHVVGCWTRSGGGEVVNGVVVLELPEDEMPNEAVREQRQHGPWHPFHAWVFTCSEFLLRLVREGREDARELCSPRITGASLAAALERVEAESPRASERPHSLDSLPAEVAEGLLQRVRLGWWRPPFDDLPYFV